jgi:hypothetical protein
VVNRSGYSFSLPRETSRSWNSNFACRIPGKEYFCRMNENTLNDIEAKIRSADKISDARKRELLQLLTTLKAEVDALSKTHGEQAESIAQFARISTHEATRGEQSPNLRELSVRGLQSSVEGFEKSNPRLVEIVNAISNTLSNLGI